MNLVAIEKNGSCNPWQCPMIFVFCLLFLASFCTTGFAQFLPGPSATLLDKAKPDECWADVGSPQNQYPAGPTCGTGLTPKVNQGYVWGLASAGQDLWFGTAPNPQCLVIGALLSAAKLPLDPIKTDSYVCEFGQSQYAKGHGLPGVVGDFRPPDIFSFNLQSKTDIKRNSQLDVAGQLLLQTTVGLRSAGSFNNVVILAGPSLLGGINLFAFNEGPPEKYIGSTHLSQYSDIRQWVVAGSSNSLYTGVENTNGTGSVLLWTGNASNPFSFQVVSDNIDNEVAYITEHNHQLWVTTWPTSGHYAGLWMSPKLPLSGPVDWTEVWSAEKYEPDPVTATVYAGGAMASFNGYLYWGMMIVPFSAAIAHANKYGPPQPDESGHRNDYSRNVPCHSRVPMLQPGWRSVFRQYRPLPTEFRRQQYRSAKRRVAVWLYRDAQVRSEHGLENRAQCDAHAAQVRPSGLWQSLQHLYLGDVNL